MSVGALASAGALLSLSLEPLMSPTLPAPVPPTLLLDPAGLVASDGEPPASRPSRAILRGHYGSVAPEVYAAGGIILLSPTIVYQKAVRSRIGGQFCTCQKH